jgi:hypothetical protein
VGWRGKDKDGMRDSKGRGIYGEGEGMERRKRQHQHYHMTTSAYTFMLK